MKRLLSLALALALLPAAASAQTQIIPTGPSATSVTPATPGPQQIQDWCALHGISKNSMEGDYCSTAASLPDIQKWCAGASRSINPNYPDIQSAAVQYCTQLLTGEVVETMESLNPPAECNGDPVCLANHTTVTEMGRRRAGNFPDANFLRHLSKDERTVAMDNGTPCHIERFNAVHYAKQTWWYCGYDGQYVDSYTFTNGKLTSTYTP